MLQSDKNKLFYTVSSFLTLFIIYLPMMMTTKAMGKCIELSSNVISEIKYSIQFKNNAEVSGVRMTHEDGRGP